MLKRGLKTPVKICLRSVFLQLLILHFSFGLAYGAAYPGQEPEQRQALGSLTTTGEVYLNTSEAPAQATVLAGDVLRTSPGGTAMFTLAGNGSLRISPNTEIVFAGGPQYAAELKLGKVVMNSFNGPMGITLRAGSSVVVAVAEGEQSTSSIEAPSDGSFLISCLGGSVGVIPLQGGKGIFIREGQSVSVSPQGELSAMSRSGRGARSRDRVHRDGARGPAKTQSRALDSYWRRSSRSCSRCRDPERQGLRRLSQHTNGCGLFRQRDSSGEQSTDS